MAQFFINATAADLGSLPLGLVSASGSVVVEDPQSESGYSIRVDAANSSEKDVKFNNPLANVTEFNIAIKIRRISSGQNGGSIRLGSTSDRWDANWDGSEIRLRSGGITTRADGGFNRPAGVDWYIEKVSFNTETRIVTSIGYLASGSPDDGVEVAAQFSISPPSDNYLIYQAFNYPESRIEWIGIGTDGDPAPTGPISNPEQSIFAPAINSEEQMGQFAFSPGATSVLATAIDSTEMFGIADFVAGPVSILASGIPSEEVVSPMAFYAGGSAIFPDGIPSNEQFGDINFMPGPVSVSAVAIASESIVSSPEFIAGPAVIYADSVPSAELFGDLTLFNVQQLIRLVGITTDESFGSTTIEGGADLSGWLTGRLNIKPALTASVGVNRVH